MLKKEIVFSAQAEVFLILIPSRLKCVSFLRASGGVSAAQVMKDAEQTFSPRKRRCFQGKRHVDSEAAVFSAQAEVFLEVILRCRFGTRFLRASGGVSHHIQ